MKKGFTLIELLGVVVILSVIALVAGLSVDNVIKRNKERLQSSQKAQIEDAINDYLANYLFELADTTDAVLYTNIMTLSTEGFIDYKLKDPVSNEYIDPYKKIEITIKDGKSSFDISKLYKGTIKDIDKVKVCSLDSESIKDKDYVQASINCNGIDYDSLFTYIKVGNNSIQKIKVNSNYLYVNNIGLVFNEEDEQPDLPVVDKGNLAQELIKQYKSTNKVGLLIDDTGYYYKGANSEVTNNYVWWAGILWRVMSIDKNNNITMISNGPITNIAPSTTMWTTKDIYDNSYINTWLNSTGANGVLYKYLNSTDKGKIIDSTFNIGTYTNVSSITSTQHFGLLDYDQYSKANNFSTGNYLMITDNFLIGTNYGNETYITYTGEVNYAGNHYPTGIRPVVTVSNLNVVIDSTSLGTSANPYHENTTATDTSKVKVGEYISVPYTSATKYCNSTTRCLFRVVSIDNDSIKVTLNGMLNAQSSYNASTTALPYSSDITIDSVIKSFYNSISDNYKYSSTLKRFANTNYYSKDDYTVAWGTNSPAVSQSYGLPTIGEMFTGNDIDVGSSSYIKTFVNPTVIENAYVSNYYWTINGFSSSTTGSPSDYFAIDRLGMLTPLKNVENAFQGAISYTLAGVRPVIYLKKGNSTVLSFTSGNGTAEHPYILGS